MNKAFNRTSKKSESINYGSVRPSEGSCPVLFCAQCGSDEHDQLDCELFFEEMTGCK